MRRCWIKSLCSDDPKRPQLQKPMTFTRDLKTYVVASDGTRILEIPFGVDEWVEQFAPSPDAMTESLGRILSPTPPDAVPLDYAGLRKFVHDAVCKNCNEAGSVMWPHRAYVGGVMFNLHLFEPILSHLVETTSVRWYQSGLREKAIIDGGDWRYVIMPCDDKGRHPDAPRFEIEGAGVFA